MPLRRYVVVAEGVTVRVAVKVMIPLWVKPSPQ
jgi:hypothetical protein